MTDKLYQKIASSINALNNCIKTNNTVWIDKHTDNLKDYENLLPSGSGFDSGTNIDIDNSDNKKIVLYTSFHHLNDNGYYVKWTDHKIIIKPSFNDFDIKITGINYNDIKDYIGDVFYYCLMEVV